MGIEYEWPVEFHGMPAQRSQAIAIGEPYYFTGRRCKRGHLSKRYTSSSNCVQCIEEKRNVKFKNRLTKAGEQALMDGFDTYMSEPCPQGHRKRRPDGSCIECDRLNGENTRVKSKERRLVKEYGLTIADVEGMIHRQGGCEICGTHIDINSSHVDHCHESGAVRGVLCSRCNQGIGLMREDVHIMLSAIRYINAAKRLPAKSG